MRTDGSLRPEAVPQKALKVSQKKGVSRFLKALAEVLDETEEPSRDDKAAVDQMRKNRLIFWTGEPGVGKTSTYVTVRSWFEQSIEAGHWAGGRLEDFGIPPAQVSDQFWRVRWLEPLDLELLSGRPNYLAAVSARIDVALGASGDPASWTRREDDSLRDAEKKFYQLQNDIALSWDGNLRERGPSLEPDVYAAEVMRAERARLDINRRFREAVANLARHAPGCSRKKPAVFVLPIDDFYLRPDVTLELLRFLRMISSPNLLVLMMGDIDIVADLLFWNSVGEASRLIGGGGDKLLSDGPRERLLNRARAMSGAALDKLIPSCQRVTIDSMDPEETLKFAPPRREAPQEETIGSLLGGGPLGFLAVPEGKKLDSARWYIRDALQLTPRHAADLFQSLREMAQRVGASVDEDDDELRQDERKWELCVLVADQVMRALVVDAERVTPEMAEHIQNDMNDPEYIWRRRFPECIALVRTPGKSERFELQYRHRIPDKPEELKPLGPLSQAWLAVLYDLFVSFKDSSDEGRPAFKFESLTDSRLKRGAALHLKDEPASQAEPSAPQAMP